MIDQAGVYRMPADAYHADPVVGGSLSSTGARKLLPPSCPAIFEHERRHGQPHRTGFDLGHAAHTDILGIGAGTVVVPGSGSNDDWNTKAAKTAVAEARATGRTPIKPQDAAAVEAMTAAVREHPIAGPLLEPAAGPSEQVLVWPDEETGVWCRAMLDKQARLIDGRLAIVDYKTCVCAEPGAISRSIDNYGYFQQDPFYQAGAIAVGLDPDPAFLFVFQEKTPPYLVTVAWLLEEDREWGRLRNRKAMQVYRDCTASDHWPGYTSKIVEVALPSYASARHEAAWRRGDYDITDFGVVA